MTELGSSGSYLSWASPQLGVEASGHVVDCQLANHPSWVVTPPRDTPLGGASWQGAFPYRRAPWPAVGGLGRKGALLGIAVARWRLQGGGYSWRLVCQKTHPFNVSLQGRQVQHKEKLGSGFFWKRHASSLICEGGPFPLPTINRRQPLVFWGSDGRVFLSEKHAYSEGKILYNCLGGNRVLAL